MSGELKVSLHQTGPIPLKLDFACQPGEVLALFGPSGSGKSTVLRAIAGLYQPEEGRVSCAEACWQDSARSIFLKPQQRQVGLVFQNYALFPHMTALGNVMAAMGHLPQSERGKRAANLLSRMGLMNEAQDRRPSALSGGQQQRVAVARALARDPQVLLLDEPFSALDALRKNELLPFIAKLAREVKIPVIYVSHAMDEVLRLADTLVLLEQGRVAASGPLEEVLSDIRLKPLTGRYDAGSVMHAVIEGHDEAYQLTHLNLKDGTRLKVGRVDAPKGSQVRLRIHARDVGLALTPPWDISIQNILPCMVAEISQSESHLADVLLKTGENGEGSPLWSQVTRFSVAQLGLRPSSRVYAMIKAMSIARSDLAELS
ncbi:MAG: molybdenum ABC transporter ATP-binding protein [Alphaproteobacteria bacterium]|nr:molybdenum ABC transporter ATP-binding protein [Alphaproteobacteria bacterium]